MKVKIQFREARSKNTQIINQAACDSWHAAYDSILGAATVEETVQSWYDSDRPINDNIRPTERPFFVAEIDKRIVGFIEAVPGNDNEIIFHRYRIYVVPEYWGTRSEVHF